MYKIAFICGNIPIYWHSVVIFVAALVGIVFFLAAYLRKEENFLGAMMACPISIMLSLILSRLFHWYFRPDSYGSFGMAMTDFFGLGHALLGAFAGCILTACLLRMMTAIDSLPVMLDCMSFGGCGAIALGRLSCLFTPDDRGSILSGIERLPWTFPAVTTTSGALEYRFATFLFQSLTAGCIFVAMLMLLYSRKKKARDGDMALLFLFLYCVSQILWDSTRYDSMHLRSNGFIGAVQLVCVLAAVVVLVILSTRQGRNAKTLMIFRWSLILAAIGCVAYMEYYVQIRGDRAGFAYMVMGVCLILMVAIGIDMWNRATISQPNGATKKHSGKYATTRK